jgi:hypothetical protein
VITTFSVFPLAPDIGEMLVIVGTGFTTEKAPVNVDSPPPGAGVETVKSRGPRAADWEITICAVSDLLLPSTDATVIPLPNVAVVTPFTKPVPFKNTESDRPRPPVVGENLARTGAGRPTSKAFVFVAVPPGVVTETLRSPVATPAEIEMLAVNCVDDMNVTELTVIPVPLKATLDEPLVKFVPVRVTTRISPAEPN